MDLATLRSGYITINFPDTLGAQNLLEIMSEVPFRKVPEIMGRSIKKKLTSGPDTQLFRGDGKKIFQEGETKI